MDMTKSLKSFEDLDLIFKVTLENQIAKFRPKILKCTLSSEWVSGFYPNLHESNIWTDMTKSLKSFGDLDLIFKVLLESQIAKFRPKILKCTLSSEWVSGFNPNLHEFNIWT